MKSRIQKIVFIALCLSAGGLGAIATTPQIDDSNQTIDEPLDTVF